MAKGYWMIAYRSVSDPEALARYAAVALPAIQEKGGRVLARGNAAKVYEEGVPNRLVIIEFDSVEHAIETYESAEYRAALKHLEGAAERDVRMIEGV
jgi:uncharacterized protein (DUF1330 family)